jgi:hypothetical protein
VQNQNCYHDSVQILVRYRPLHEDMNAPLGNSNSNLRGSSLRNLLIQQSCILTHNFYSCRILLTMPRSSGTNSQGNYYSTPGGTNSSSGSTYHYSNSNGSYYYRNDNGSTYYNSGTGSSTYTSPSGTSYSSGSRK